MWAPRGKRRCGAWRTPHLGQPSPAPQAAPRAGGRGPGAERVTAHTHLWQSVAARLAVLGVEASGAQAGGELQTPSSGLPPARSPRGPGRLRARPAGGAFPLPPAGVRLPHAQNPGANQVENAGSAGSLALGRFEPGGSSGALRSFKYHSFTTNPKKCPRLLPRASQPPLYSSSPAPPHLPFPT